MLRSDPECTRRLRNWLVSRARAAWAQRRSRWGPNAACSRDCRSFLDPTLDIFDSCGANLTIHRHPGNRLPYYSNHARVTVVRRTQQPHGSLSGMTDRLLSCFKTAGDSIEFAAAIRKELAERPKKLVSFLYHSCFPWGTDR